MFTNINITNNSTQFKYIIEYIPSGSNKTTDVEYANGLQINNEQIDEVFFYDKNISHIKCGNHWYPITEDSLKNISKLNTTLGLIRLYFPDYSLDIYEIGHQYALTLSTWICGKHIILGNYILNRSDAYACPGVKKFLNEQYYEYIEIPIVDPFSLIYSDEWEQWRREVCGESLDNNLINSVGSVLYCSLHPIIEVDNNEYIKTAHYIGGQNSINLTQDINDYLSLSISSNTTRSLKANEAPAIEFNLNFNKYYDKSLQEYLKETYGLEKSKVKFVLVIGNSESLYAVLTSEEMDLTTSYRFNKDVINKDNFKNGNGWIPGIYLTGSVEVLNDDGDTILYLLSNKIPFTKQLLSYFVQTDFLDRYKYVINNVNLNDVNMNILNINAVNKTEQKIVNMDKPINNVSGITQSVFYRVTDFPSIVVKPSVNENICINLDQYKHLVKSFILQIEGIKFMEIGRIKSGVIFKIIGNKLPKQITNGQYYILNQDSELISSGKYVYEI